jgi:hypothetical protein
MNELFEFLEANKITPNQYYLLWCIHTGNKPKNINAHLELRALQASNFVKGAKLNDSALALIGHTPAVKEFSFEEGASSIDTFISIFPKGKLPTGKPARVNKKNIEDAFKWFFNNYDYSWDVILQATLYYVETYEKSNFMYMRNSQYFIRKQNTDRSWDSELANYCEIIINGDEEDTSHFTDRVV